REHSVEVEIDQLETERAKRRYVSEFLSSELTALSLHNNEEDSSVTNTKQMDITDLDANLLKNKSRKHVVMVTDLDAYDSEDSEEKSDEPKGINPRKNKEVVHERRISEIMDNGKLSPIPEDPVIDSEEMDLDLDVENNRISYDGYLGDDDEDGVEEMEL
ncbi:6534_t:CDS:2, partial [Racocetra fulgida]